MTRSISSGHRCVSLYFGGSNFAWQKKMSLMVKSVSSQFGALHLALNNDSFVASGPDGHLKAIIM